MKNRREGIDPSRSNLDTLDRLMVGAGLFLSGFIFCIVVLTMTMHYKGW